MAQKHRSKSGGGAALVVTAAALGVAVIGAYAVAQAQPLPPPPGQAGITFTATPDTGEAPLAVAISGTYTGTDGLGVASTTVYFLSVVAGDPTPTLLTAFETTATGTFDGQYTFSSGGAYFVLVSSEPSGSDTTAVNSTTIPITVTTGPQPVPTISLNVSATTGAAPLPITFSGIYLDAEGAPETYTAVYILQESSNGSISLLDAFETSATGGFGGSLTFDQGTYEVFMSSTISGGTSAINSKTVTLTVTPTLTATSVTISPSGTQPAMTIPFTTTLTGEIEDENGNGIAGTAYLFESASGGAYALASSQSVASNGQYSFPVTVSTVGSFMYRVSSNSNNT